MIEKPANKGSHVIAAFGGLGKSHFARSYPSAAIDLEAVPYKYIYHRPEHLRALERQEYEKLKEAGDRTVNSDFPENYIHDIVRNLGKYAFVMVVLSPEALSGLEQLDVSYAIVYPEDSTQGKLVERMRRRGNNETFIEKIQQLLATPYEKESLQRSLHPAAFFMLGPDEYIEDLARREYGFEPNSLSE